MISWSWPLSSLRLHLHPSHCCSCLCSPTAPSLSLLLSQHLVQFPTLSPLLLCRNCSPSFSLQSPPQPQFPAPHPCYELGRDVCMCVRMCVRVHEAAAMYASAGPQLWSPKVFDQQGCCCECYCSMLAPTCAHTLGNVHANTHACTRMLKYTCLHSVQVWNWLVQLQLQASSSLRLRTRLSLAKQVITSSLYTDMLAPPLLGRRRKEERLSVCLWEFVPGQLNWCGRANSVEVRKFAFA